MTFPSLPSLLSWERGLKFYKKDVSPVSKIVAPLVGAWIEIVMVAVDFNRVPSLLSWERGLKSQSQHPSYIPFARRSSRGSVD